MWRETLCCISIVALSGCSYFKRQEAAAPVVALGEFQSVTHGTHVVARGETLYEIAWRYGRDYRDIALANHIHAPYVIYPGQKLTLKKPKHPPSVYAKEEVVARQKTATLPKATTVLKKETSKIQTSITAWHWPAEGKIIKTFSPSRVGPKGIDISNKLGTAVLSAQNGKVVYAGQGLRGYGQLVIIKHNDTYLSAYGHNSELLVKEGQAVSKGQMIAKMGKSDSQEVKLHFEIRKNGQPINPLEMLPPKTT
ncbi:MAG: peptidoglycan DD-metalloendopeptidase family protein [Proteobacteria bacterium]|nr:peptidoglycan DD-metalloendopeptidase family protein [Pseudomonadota bacterium]